MLNYIWLGLVLCAVLLGGWDGRLKEVADKSFDMARIAVIDIAFPLVGIMVLWLGIMRLAERSGLVSLLARALQPVMRWLFPDVPADHPAMGSMLMNIAANMLGLGNAATPLGLRAMKDLETINRRPGTATNAMCTFLAINTSSVQLIPVTAIAILAANKSTNPTAIVGTAIIATACACCSGITMAKLLPKLPMFRLPPLDDSAVARVPSAENQPTAAGTDKLPVKEAATLRPLRWWGLVVLAAYLLSFAWFFIRAAFPGAFGSVIPLETANQNTFIRVVNAVSLLSIPFLLSVFPLYAALRRVKVYEEFVDGAKEGFDVAIRIIPYLVAMLFAIGMFRAAGGIEMIAAVLKPALDVVHFPVDLLPMCLMRPLSGSGSQGMFAELVNHFGADSLIARTAGTIYGSTETTFYVLAVYFGSVAIKRTRYALIAGLTADFVSVVASIAICRIMFG